MGSSSTSCLAKAQQSFVSTWGVGVGLNQAQEARDVGIASCRRMAAALTVLELLWVVTNTRWLEDTID